jgi:hypothetical protein
MPCNHPQDLYGCVSFHDWEKSLGEGCQYPCFTLGSFEPEKELLEKKMSLPRLQPPQAIREAPPELELPPITKPLVSQPSIATPEPVKAPISDSSPLLGAFLIAAVSSLGVPLLKDFIKSKWKKKDNDSPIECKPAQVKTNARLKKIEARIDKLENESGLSLDSSDIEEIKKRLHKLETNE